ncbi:family 16 glycoside hydrolase [uncultured Alistipes sp.]|uniref:family 16 glycoside hydrolase n=1 Tax=uncultured Alistipes sp. TaxID=538949 RepID=UPI0025FC8E3F|nr:family 16 glycoside hydrolase [uncultured Alistipes sp.]
MKKIIKQLFILGAVIALLPIGASAQKPDARQRNTATVVADALAQLPAAKVTVFDQVMGELAATGSEGVEMIASMLVPADKGKNATLEYALSGVVAYVTTPAPGNETLQAGVRKGLLAAIERCSDNPNRAFLLSQLQLCSTVEDADAFVRYLDDPYLADYAIRALISTPGTERLLLGLASQSDLTASRKQALAYAFGEKHMAEAELVLLEWLAGADADLTAAIYHALAVCGSQASLKPLAEAAAKAGYGWDNLSSTDSYLRLVGNLAKAGDTKSAEKAAKALLKCDREYVRGAALAILADILGEQKAMPYILSAIKDGPAEYRYAALQTLGKDDDKIFAQVAAGMSRYDVQAQAAVLAWLGERGARSQIAVITAAVASSDDCVARAAIEASGRIGGQQALLALSKALEGAHAAAAVKALLAFNGSIDAEVERLLMTDNSKVLVPALKLAAARRMTVVADRVFVLLDSKDAEVRTMAYAALPYVVGPQHMDHLATLLEKVDEQYSGQLQTALIRTSGQLPVEKQYDTIARYMRASVTPARYYPVLAHTGTYEAIESLLASFDQGDRAAAFSALLTVENPEMIDILYRIATENPAMADHAVMRFSDLVAKEPMTPIRRYQYYRQGLELKPTAAVRKKLLGYLSSVYTLPALMLAADYLSDTEVAEPAAHAVKTIVAKSTPMPGGEAVRVILEQAREVYRQKMLTVTDAGYAVDEITELLGKIPAAGFAALPVDNLAGWRAVPGNPAGAKKPMAHELAKLRKAAAEAMAQNWSTNDGLLSFAGKTPSTIAMGKEYENFEMWIEWRSAGLTGIAVRSVPCIALVETEENTTPAAGRRKLAFSIPADAGNKWNTLYVKVMDDRITLCENGVVIAENAVLENPDTPGIPVPVRGAIQLLGDAAAADFRDIYINELPSTPVFELSPEERAQGYEVLFDGRSLYKWTGNTTNYVPLDGTIDVTASYGGSGNLYTVQQYSDFDLRFEFRFLREGVNNGIGIRTPMGVDAAYQGMEIQILDHDAPIYKNLKVYQQHGSVYGIIPAERVVFGELGTWNTMEIKAVGDRITVTTNGRVILDGDIREACKGHNVSEDGSKTNPYTVDRKNHPGLFNKTGHIGLLGHGEGIQFRNLRVLELSPKAGRK